MFKALFLPIQLKFYTNEFNSYCILFLYLLMKIILVYVLSKFIDLYNCIFVIYIYIYYFKLIILIM